MDPLPGFSRFGGPFGGNLRIFVAREFFGRGLGAILGALGPILDALGALLGRIFDVYVVQNWLSFLSNSSNIETCCPKGFK